MRLGINSLFHARDRICDFLRALPMNCSCRSKPSSGFPVGRSINCACDPSQAQLRSCQSVVAAVELWSDDTRRFRIAKPIAPGGTDISRPRTESALRFAAIELDSAPYGTQPQLIACLGQIQREVGLIYKLQANATSIERRDRIRGERTHVDCSTGFFTVSPHCTATQSLVGFPATDCANVVVWGPRSLSYTEPLGVTM
jgi:hypothetical protein